MPKLLTGLAAAAAVALMSSAGLACDYHKSHVTAEAPQTQEGVAMSTYDGATSPLATADEERTAKTATAAVTNSVCAEGDEDCASDSE